MSRYLTYLPRVLRGDEPEGPALWLGSFLSVVEKVLDGVDDGVALPAVVGRERAYRPITQEITRASRLYDPWTAPPEFLPWLASWVALELPTLQGQPLWDEYQRRKVIADMAGIHRLRGRKAGLNRHLELFAVGRTRPRVTLDDGTRLLELVPAADAVAAISGLVTRGPVVAGVAARLEGLTRPWCLAAGAGGSLFVGDSATPPGASVALPPRVWHLDASGRPDVAGAPPVPRPVAPDTLGPLGPVVAVAVAPPAAAVAETLFVLDAAARLWSVVAGPGRPWPQATATLLAALGGPGAPVTPVAMVRDPASGDLLVLDRGAGPGEPARPSVLVVRTAGPTVNRRPLASVAEPLSLAVDTDGTLLIGDGGDQAPADPPGPGGNVLRVVDRAAATWTATPLLPPDTPLLAPTALARIRGGNLCILDAGLRPFAPDSNDPFVGAAAEPAAVYELVPGSPAGVRRVSEVGHLVYPTGMVAVGDRLVISDPGQPEVAGLQSFRSRVRPFMFDVVVHFAAPRLPVDPTERKQELDRAVGTVRTIIDAQKPAHTVWNLITAI